MSKERFQLKYDRSKFWLILWLVVFFPIAIVLALSHLKIVSGSRTYQMEYDGARLWLYFWALIFCPVLILLFVLNGSIVKIIR